MSRNTFLHLELELLSEKVSDCELGPHEVKLHWLPCGASLLHVSYSNSSNNIFPLPKLSVSKEVNCHYDPRMILFFESNLRETAYIRRSMGQVGRSWKTMPLHGKPGDGAGIWPLFCPSSSVACFPLCLVQAEVLPWWCGAMQLPASKIHTQQLCSFIGLCFFDGMGEWACGNAFDSIQILVANIEQCWACFQTAQS